MLDKKVRNRCSLQEGRTSAHNFFEHVVREMIDIRRSRDEKSGTVLGVHEAKKKSEKE